MKVVQERLGHSTFAITADIYSHVSADLQQQAAGVFGSALRNTTRPGADEAEAST
jgi:integrase